MNEDRCLPIHRNPEIALEGDAKPTCPNLGNDHYLVGVKKSRLLRALTALAFNAELACSSCYASTGTSWTS
jgi:hypothetical protein